MGLGVRRGEGEIRRGESHADSTQQWIERSKHASLEMTQTRKKIKVREKKAELREEEEKTEKNRKKRKENPTKSIQ